MIKRMGVRSEIPDATFNLVGDRVIPVIVLVHAFQKGADLALVLHLKDRDPDLRRHEDFARRLSWVKIDFYRKWYHRKGNEIATILSADVNRTYAAVPEMRS